jgi:hypothetical protein
MEKLITCLFVLCLHFSYGQSYQNYFQNKIVSDSLTRKGNYTDAIPYLRLCIAEPAMVTVDDEFLFGYALFKAGKIDSSAVFLKKALSNDYHFHDMIQFEYWTSQGVFERLDKHEEMKGVSELIKLNTLLFVNSTSVNSSLRKILLDARERDQRFRGKNLDYKKQHKLDKANQKLLLKIIKTHGWPTNDIVGDDGSNAAFLIAQHADNNKNFQQDCLRYIQRAYYSRKIDPASYAYIIDRDRINSGKSQLFGTQFEAEYVGSDFVLHLKPVEDEKLINLRRKVFGLSTVEDYLLQSKERLQKYGNR